MTLLIKGMVCDRCIYVLEQEMTALGFEVLNIKLGEMVLKDTEVVLQKLEAIKTMLKSNGFELIYNKNQKTINMIKELVEKGIRMQLDSGTPTKFTTLISNKLHKNYNTLSALFSSAEGVTLEKYIIHRKIEMVKELLVYTEMSLTEIAHRLGYSSQAYLSNQLKRYTGFTSRYFKPMKQEKKDIINMRRDEALSSDGSRPI
ncbi:MULTISPECIES: helix-turn-helix domain-containing protein [Olivibacter]|jgi:AraC-like DNA-binding protein|uniref:Helix-turn-helix domain-containing protein n=2 Tax=Olivibacter TaxID=376469 RepID=A0ABV6HRC5_9SPHI|nr:MULTISPECIES: AraC family transcriptional regulator [Olivibacter]MDX3917428.1 AraC family transcriptional regulator [Pseudosphingobacterium sp.]QEL03932.1 helix-turn-helix transcriptional regulator [Olivibacter sp. LS-1]